MIISHKHKFIFIKTKKTAGTSVEISLSAICGEEDILAPISLEDEETRKNLGYRTKQNFNLKGFELHSHYPAKNIKKLLEDNIWKDYYKFCFERNPWDKVISWYYWHYQQETKPTISDFIESGEASLVSGPGGYDLYTENDGVIIDHVCYYENIENELEHIKNTLNLPTIPPLTKAKSHTRKEKKHYREYFNEKDKKAIETIFHKEIALMGYKF